MDNLRLIAGIACLTLVSACVAVMAGRAVDPPHSQSNLCSVFDQYPEWYDAAIRSSEKWGTPPHILMSFVKYESAFVHNAKPPRKRFWFVPLWRPSSATGYAQAKDVTWAEYRDENRGLFKSRADIEDALDFIGWYNHKSFKGLGISKHDPRNLYLAYHEGRTGYARGSYHNKPEVVRIADRVERQARAYDTQLQDCEERFRCRRWYQFGPFCS